MMSRHLVLLVVLFVSCLLLTTQEAMARHPRGILGRKKVSNSINATSTTTPPSSKKSTIIETPCQQGYLKADGICRMVYE